MKYSRFRDVTLLLCLLCLAPLSADYDPLKLPEDFEAQTLDITLHDEKRKRDIPIRIWLPPEQRPAPVILFSHGLGGSRENNPYLGTHWSARGYVVIFLQHAGSDAEVWKQAPIRERRERLQQAASPTQYLARVQDVSSLLNLLPELEALQGRIDMNRIGMSGHSFGGGTTQGVSGQKKGRFDFSDKRLRAALIMSPSLPKRGNAETMFNQVSIPWFLMTGTKDGSPLDPNMDPATRAELFDYLPDGDHLLLILDAAEHHAFGDGTRRKRKRIAHHHTAILALSTAFWDTHLSEKEEAKHWLNSEAARTPLHEADVLKRKNAVSSTDLPKSGKTQP